MDDPRDVDELVRRFLAALSEGDAAAVGELVHPEVQIRTKRTVHRGRPAAMDWSKKVFDHLDRRYVPIEIERRSDLVAIKAELRYIWRESEEIGDRREVTIELGIRDGLISSWDLREESG